MTDVRPFELDRVDELESLFGSDPVTDGCWCMWFVVRVADYHEARGEGNRAAFVQMARDSAAPLGLVAYEEGEPVGWCAAGPRSRFERILKAPTMKHRDKAEDATVWLVPCFFVRRGARDHGIARALLAGAVALAREHGAAAIEGFPLAGTKRRSTSGDVMTGVEPLFESCGFEPVHRPSGNRVIMRLDLLRG